MKGRMVNLDVSADPTVRLERVALDCDRSAAEVLSLLAGDTLPFALTGRWAGGGAILGAEPLAVADGDEDPFALLDRLPALDAGAGTPAGAVGGGWFGWLGYRLLHRVERVPEGPPRPVPMPEFHLAYYDHVLRCDPDGRWWFEALAGDARRDALRDRLEQLRLRLGIGGGGGGRAAIRDDATHPVPTPASTPTPTPAPAPAPAPLTLGRAAAQHHLDAIVDCRRRIAAGEIFQANLCVRFESRFRGTAADLFVRALQQPSPGYAACFDTPHGAIASLSPELFLRRRGETIETAPIKGTAPRRADDPAGAARAAAALRASAKDAAEHVMIVDLMRNDLGRVARYGTVQAATQPDAEPHPGLWHLVSRVHARLRPGVSNADVLRATFPPGSVTGAPKVQALRVIAELELTGREVYTGAIGFASPLAGLELNVAIRTLELRHGALWLGAGGGIVADSDPRQELEEALVKARPIAAAIGTTAELER